MPQGQRIQYVLLAGRGKQDESSEDPLTAAKACLVLICIDQLGQAGGGDWAEGRLVLVGQPLGCGSRQRPCDFAAHWLRTG